MLECRHICEDLFFFLFFLILIGIYCWNKTFNLFGSLHVPSRRKSPSRYERNSSKQINTKHYHFLWACVHAVKRVHNGPLINRPLIHAWHISHKNQFRQRFIALTVLSQGPSLYHNTLKSIPPPASHNELSFSAWNELSPLRVQSGADLATER